MSIMKTSINASNYNNRLISSLQLHHHIKQFVVLHNQSFSFNPLSSKQSSRSSFLENQSLRYLNNGDREQNNNRSNRDFAIYSSDHQGDLVSLGTFMESWKGWIIGALVTVILPFLTNKWGPLLKWTKELEAAEERVEEIAEAIEQVAVDVEKVAEDFAEKLPEGGKLRGAMIFVENAAKQVIKDADFVEELMDKVEEAEEKLEDMIEDAEAQSKDMIEDAEGKSKDMIDDAEGKSKDMIEDAEAKSKDMIEDAEAKSKSKEVAEVAIETK